MSEFEIAPSFQSQTFADSLNRREPNDIFKITLDEPASIGLEIRGTNARADWQFSDELGNIIKDGSVRANGAPKSVELQDLEPGKYVLELSRKRRNTDYTLQIDRLTGLPETQGAIKVGDLGELTVDFLLDGGARRRSSVGIYNLQGMEQYQPGSRGYVREAARRVASNSFLGYPHHCRCRRRRVA